MLFKKTAFWLAGIIWLIPGVAQCQSTDTLAAKTQLPSNQSLTKISSRASEQDQSLTLKTENYLNSLSRTEARLIKRLQRVDGNAARHWPAANYRQWIDKMNDTAALRTTKGKTYIPRLDTLHTTLQFLQSGQGSASVPGISSGQLADANSRVQLLQAHLDQSALIGQYITQRRQQIEQYLGRYSHLPSAVTQTFNQYKATAYYYRQQIEAFKNSLNDPQKIQQQAVTQLSKLPAYQHFLATHSMLASLFQLPAGYATGAALQGLQTKTQIQQQIQQQAAGSGSQGSQAMDQQLQQAKSKLTGMQNSLSKYGFGGQNIDMPTFSPNGQKTKSLFGRLIYGVNLQFAQSTVLFPATGDLGLSLGYKINDNSSAGIGIAYDMGLGSDWQHIHFSSQGIGLRSYMDWKIKKTYYVVGGYEESYLNSFSSIAQLKSNRSGWQPSALIGLEKKYKLSQKLQGNIQLLFDALYRQEVPQGQAIKLRVGYNF